MLKSQVFTSNGNFVVPTDVSGVILQKIGPGGGGEGHGGWGFGSSGKTGSSGEFCLNKMVPVTPGDTITITVGTGGAGAILSVGICSAGVGNAVFGTSIALPAKRGSLNGAEAGYGGGPNGGLGNQFIGFPDVNMGHAESPTYFGGTAGMSGNATAYSNADSCGGAAGPPATGPGNREEGGSGGGAAVWPSGGIGGTGGTGSAGQSGSNGGNATGWGAGGGSSGANDEFPLPPLSGGNGAAGAVVVYWFAP